jgi:molecular chaperone Hsp33
MPDVRQRPMTSDPTPTDPRTAPAEGDRLSRFILDAAGVRGVHVSLRETWAQIRARGDDPAAGAALLGETVAAAALFTGHVKIGGRLSVQARGEGPLRLLFAECTAAGTLRGIAQFAEGVEGADAHDPGALGADAMLAITIENPSAAGDDPVRYQSIVGLDAPSLSAAFERYFVQSEQLPTRLLLACDETQATGLMLQKLPGDEGDDDGWTRISALFDTLGADELRSTPAPTLLLRLFHEDAPRLLGDKPLRFACSCSRERVASMLQSLGADEARAALIDGSARIRCEFCGETYRFDAPQIDGLFTPRERPMEAPERLQ